MALFGKKKDEANLPNLPLPPPPDLSAPTPASPPIAPSPPSTPVNGPPSLFPQSSNASPFTPPTPNSSGTSPSFNPPNLARPSIQAPTPSAMPAAPSPNQIDSTDDHMTLLTEDVEKLVESNVAKKWDKINDSVKKIEEWKTTTESKLEDFQKQIEQLDTKLSSAQNAITGKVNEYNSSIKDVNVQLKSLSQVFEKILPTFTDNIKALQSITKNKTKTK